MAASSALLLVGLSARGSPPGVGRTTTAAQPILTRAASVVSPTGTAAPAASPVLGSKEPSVHAVTRLSG
eukprot:10497919-Alexandrium_andersonii.AAC.1